MHNAKEKENLKNAWDMWMVQYEHMSEENFKTFEEFYKELTKPQVVVGQKETVQDTFNRFKNKVKKVT